MTLTEELARRISAIRYETLPREAIANAKIAILDTVAVTLAGAAEASTATLMRVPGVTESGPSRVFGHRHRVSALNAALVNGTASHAMDFDDVHASLGGHPSAMLTPALFALADLQATSGRDLIAAFIAGFETETRVGKGVNYHHYEKGWHPTVTLGIFGTTAACAHLMRLDEAQTSIALAIAVSLASGVKANFGTMTKPLHVGHASRSGLFAALLAREGFTANPLAFEHQQGFLEVFNGAGHYEAGRILADWGSPYQIEAPGVGVKLYPCCGSTHCPIDGALTLAARHRVRADDVERIVARIHARRLPHTNRPDPQSGLEAKFSVQYCIARALVDGRVSVEHFEGDAHRDPAVRRLMSKVRIEPYTEIAADTGDTYPVAFTVTLRSGEEVTHRQPRPSGRSPGDPVPADRLEAKFRSCVTRVLPQDDTHALLAALNDLEGVADVRTLPVQPRG